MCNLACKSNQFRYPTKKKIKKKIESPDKLHTASKVKKDLEKPKSSNFRLSGFSYKSCFPPN